MQFQKLCLYFLKFKDSVWWGKRVNLHQKPCAKYFAGGASLPFIRVLWLKLKLHKIHPFKTNKNIKSVSFIPMETHRRWVAASWQQHHHNRTNHIWLKTVKSLLIIMMIVLVDEVVVEVMAFNPLFKGPKKGEMGRRKWRGEEEWKKRSWRERWEGRRVIIIDNPSASSRIQNGCTWLARWERGEEGKGFYYFISVNQWVAKNEEKKKKNLHLV